MEIELWFLLPLGIRLIVGVGLAKVLCSYGKVIAFIVYKKVPLIHKDCLFSFELCWPVDNQTTIFVEFWVSIIGRKWKEPRQQLLSQPFEMLLRSLRRNFIGIFKRLPFHMCLSLLNSYNEKSIVHFVRFANALLKHFEYLKANNERCLFTNA